MGLSFPSLTSPSLAKSLKAGDLTIDNIWSRPSPGQPNNAAVFMTIANNGEKWDRLVAVETPMAENAVLHKSAIMSGLLKMYLTKGMYIDPGKTLAMRPDKFHIMLVNLKASMIIGETFPMTLVFEKAGRVQVRVMVKKDTGSKSKTKDREKEGK